MPRTLEDVYEAVIRLEGEVKTTNTMFAEHVREDTAFHAVVVRRLDTYADRLRAQEEALSGHQAVHRQNRWWISGLASVCLAALAWLWNQMKLGGSP